MAGVNFPVSVPLRASDGVSSVLDKVGGKFSKLGKKMRQVGKGLTLGLTVPIAAFGGASINASVNFDRAMNRVQAKLGETIEGVDSLRSRAKELGEDTEFSATQAAEGMAFLSQAGFETVEVFEAIPSVLTLAAAAELELAEAADLATNVLTGFGFKVEDLGKPGGVVDVLASATVRGNTNLQQLAEGMKFAGPTAKSLGQEFETTVAILDKLADAGFQGQLGGNALKRGMLSLIEPSATAKKTLAKLQITAADIFSDTGGLEKFDDILALLEERGADGIDIFRIFGARAGPGMAALLGQGSDAVKELAEAIKGDLGRAVEIQNIQMQGTVGQLARARSKWEALLITIGESGLIEALGVVLEKFSKIVDKLREADPRLIKIGLVIAGIAAAIGPLLIVLGSLLAGLGGLVTILSSPVFLAFTAWITAVAVPAMAAMGAAFVAFLISPIGLISVAIGALIAGGIALVKNWRFIKAAAGQIWIAIANGLKSAFDFMKSIVARMVDIIPDWMIKVLEVVNPVRALTTIARLAGVGGEEPSEAQLQAAGVGSVSTSETTNRSEARVKVDFQNVPAGTRIETEGSGEIPVDVDAGFNMLAAG